MCFNTFGQKHYHHNFSKKKSYSTCDQMSLDPNTSGTHEIKVVRRVLAANDIIANNLRSSFSENKVFVLNIMSSPGSGKTTTLQKILPLMMKDFKCSVIVGDICTTNDADRLAQSGATVIQINTDKFGGDCHLTASAVGKAAENIDLNTTELLIVENIGNLVCPAEFDIGEDSKIVMLSITEGEDKPAKYPLMFRICDATLLNKIDLLPYLDFDIKLAKDTIKLISPKMPIFEISAKTEEGLDFWATWLKNQVAQKLELS